MTIDCSQYDVLYSIFACVKVRLRAAARRSLCRVKSAQVKPLTLTPSPKNSYKIKPVPFNSDLQD